MNTKSTIEEDRPLKVLVCGGGIGGLSTALFLRRAGHVVEVFESSKFGSETGAAIHVPSNANGLLRKLGLSPEDHGANLTEWVSEYRPSGEMVFSKDVRPLAHVFPYPWQLIHRVDLHDALKLLATSSEGQGTPVILRLRNRVISVDPDTPSITLEDGSTHVGDLVIASDGINSRIRTALIKNGPTTQPSGSSAFRFLIPTDLARSDPKTMHLVEKTGELKLLYGQDRRIVIYPCRNNTLLNFVALHPDEESEANEDWDQSASKEAMLASFSSYPEDIQALLAKTSPEGVKLWKLLDHDELGRENWVHGKIALLGDAAHGFLPHQGQGGAQAIEDGAAIGALFPLGTRPSDVPRRLQLYVQARYDRATMVQDFTRQAAFKTSRGKHGGKILDPMQFTEANFTHDAYDHARGLLLRDLNKSELYPRMPLSFGPNPGPRQDFYGKNRVEVTPSSYKISYITFKTHKSYLSTLLPSDEFTLGERGSWATASFAVTRRENVDWLGGRGYSSFGLYLHNVTLHSVPKLEGSTDTIVKGDFLPVLFENMADSVIIGREELGSATMFATLQDQSSQPSSFELSAGWEGTEFCHLSLEDLRESPDSEAVLETPLLHYKVIPSSKTKGQINTEYVISDPAVRSAQGERRWKAKQARVTFTELNEKDLKKAFPTLAHIIQGLRDVRIVEVLQAGVQASS